MKLHTQVEGQNTTQSSLELFKIYPRITELYAPVRYRTKKKSVISMLCDIDTLLDKMTSKDHGAASHT